MNRKVFVVTRRDWNEADHEAVHGRNIAAVERSLALAGDADVHLAAVEDHTDGVSINLIYEWMWRR
jgi:hypothetical protein